MATCEALFGKTVQPAEEDVIAASLSNVNGQAHLAMVLANLTRMERGEKWHPFEYATDSVSRLAVALDAERLATAAAYQAPVQSFAEFLHFTYGVPLSPVADMFRAMHARGDDMVGPATLESRWITQDMPFITVPMMELAKQAAVKTPLHDGALNVMSALYGQDLHAGNDLFSALEIATRSVDEIRALARGGDVTGSGEAECPGGELRGRQADNSDETAAGVGRISFSRNTNIFTGSVWNDAPLANNTTTTSSNEAMNRRTPASRRSPAVIPGAK